jgi:hypothetical protein
VHNGLEQNHAGPCKRRQAELDHCMVVVGAFAPSWLIPGRACVCPAVSSATRKGKREAWGENCRPSVRQFYKLYPETITVRSVSPFAFNGVCFCSRSTPTKAEETTEFLLQKPT